MDSEDVIHAGAMRIVAQRLSAVMLAGVWTTRALSQRTEQVLGYATLPEQKALIAEVLEQFRTPYPPAPDTLAKLIMESPSFRDAAHRRLGNPSEMAITLRSPPFAPAEPLAKLGLPKLATVAALAKWLQVSVGQLDWLADARRMQFKTKNPSLQHYRYSFIAKASGPPRLLEAPKPKLKAIQRHIPHGILDRAPTHSSAHGFVKGRSCQTAAQIHAGEDIVATVDLANFFPSISMPRVHAIFRTLGYPWAVARALTSLCSTATPFGFFDRLDENQRPSLSARRQYEALHLAQGAPTSPALANLSAWRLDMRLRGLADAYEANYTRYADDLTFSGGSRLSARIDSFLDVVTVIVEDEGYSLNAQKTRVMRKSSRQQVTGIIVNDWINVERRTYDALKATLYNCVKHGPNSQSRSSHSNFRAHLEGRISWIEALNPNKGARLRTLFEKIKWPQADS